MTNFVHDRTALPDGKEDFEQRPAVPANKKIVAAEHNTVMRALYDLRGATPEVHNVLDYGAVGDGVTDDWAAFDAAINGGGPAAGRRVFVPGRTFFLSRTLRVHANVHLFGVTGTGFIYPDMCGVSRLEFPGGVTGIIFENFHTSPQVLGGGNADWAQMENIAVRARAKTTPLRHGISTLCRVALRRVVVESFSGDLLHIVAATDMNIADAIAWAPSTQYAVGDVVYNVAGYRYFCQQSGLSAAFGAGPAAHAGYADHPITDGTCVWSWVDSTNANMWVVENCSVGGGGRHGLYVNGADANAGYCFGLNSGACAGWGIKDASFLGNTYVGCHTSGNALGPYSGNGWFLGCYSEGDQPPSEGPGLFIGGLHGAGFVDGTSQIMPTTLGATGALVRLSPFITEVQGEGGAPDFSVAFGDAQAAGRALSISAQGTSWALKFGQRFATNAYSWNRGGLDMYHGWGTAGDGCVSGGRTLVPTQFLISRLHGLGFVWGGSKAQRVGYEAAPPTSSVFGQGVYGQYRAGDRVWNTDPTQGGVSGWVCIQDGTVGDYTEGRTGTTTSGSGVVVLSAPTTVLKTGDDIWLDGWELRITAVNSAGTEVTVNQTTIPDGSGRVFSYRHPAWRPYGAVLPEPSTTPVGAAMRWSGSAWVASPERATVTQTDTAISVPAGAGERITLELTSVADITFSATPLIAARPAGSEITLVNASAHTLTLTDDGTLAGSKVILASGTTLALAPGGMVKLLAAADGTHNEILRFA